MEEKEEIIVSPKIIFEVLRKNLVFIIFTAGFPEQRDIFTEYAKLRAEAG